MIILGIDPGTATTGWGIIKTAQNTLSCLDYGTIETPKEDAESRRLLNISKELDSLIKKYHPDMASMEKIFFFKNPKTVIPVTQARGVMLLGLEKHRVPIYEFTPPQIKTATTGYGRATKKQIQEMVKRLLSLEKIPKPDDAADALAAAICLSFQKKYE